MSIQQKTRVLFGHDDDLEGAPPCRDVAATSTLLLRTGTFFFVGLEASWMVWYHNAGWTMAGGFSVSAGPGADC